jgi:hypothetical protein
MTQASALREFIQRRMRELRGDRSWRLEDVALRAQEAGLPWKWDTVAAIERGTRVLYIEELLLVPRIFDVGFEDLFQAEERIFLSASVTVSTEVLRHTLVGKAEDPLTHTIEMTSVDPPENQVGLPTIIQWWGLTEQRAAERLGVTREDLTQAAARLWGSPLSAERDRRIQQRIKEDMSPETLRALRGHITRELTIELHKELHKSIGEKKARRRRKGGKQ